MLQQGGQRALKLTLIAFAVVCFVALSVLIGSQPVQMASIQRWTQTTSYPLDIAIRSAVVHDDVIYVVGGSPELGQAEARGFSAKIRIDGSLEPWQPISSLPIGIYLHALVASDTHLYLIGGWTGTSTRYEVLSAPFNGDGTIGSWATVADYPTLPEGITLHDAVAVNGILYVVGGRNGFDPLDRVYYAAMAGGGLGAWRPGPNLPESRFRHAVVVTKSHLYVVGGATEINDVAVARATVFYAPIQNSGQLGAWNETTTLPQSRYYHSAVIHDNRIVVLGGTNGESDFASVLSAPINANGTIGSWSPEPALPAPRTRLAAVAVQKFGSDYIYTIAGLDPSGNAHSEVYHSSVPPTPTPTPTPTVTPAVLTTLENAPGTWLGPGDEVTYSILLQGNNSDDFASVSVFGMIPENVTLLEESITVAEGGVYTVTGDGGPGSTIEWTWTEGLAKDVSSSVSYRVRRLPPPTPAIPPSLSIDKLGPATATSGQLITYTLTVTNNLPIGFNNVVIRDRIPTGATYVSGGDGPPDNDVVTWSLPAIAPDATVQLQFAVRAARTIVNSDYSVSADNTTAFKGNRVVITRIGNTPPPPGGDGVAITNDGAIVRWVFDGVTYDMRSNSVRNPKFDIFLPLVAGSR